ncbi:hypothetical protein HDV05_008807 [Chytridiales sp. JEL 0842]|nr:hypothetical protein HDV05_008807 [Chytridiales sp. JEL 0842]
MNMLPSSVSVHTLVGIDDGSAGAASDTATPPSDNVIPPTNNIISDLSPIDESTSKEQPSPPSNNASPLSPADSNNSNCSSAPTHASTATTDSVVDINTFLVSTATHQYTPSIQQHTQPVITTGGATATTEQSQRRNTSTNSGNTPEPNEGGANPDSPSSVEAFAHGLYGDFGLVLDSTNSQLPNQGSRRYRRRRRARGVNRNGHQGRSDTPLSPVSTNGSNNGPGTTTPTAAQKVHKLFLAFLAFFHSTWYTIALLINPIFLITYGPRAQCAGTSQGLGTANNPYAIQWYLGTISILALIDFPRLPLKSYARRLNHLRSSTPAENISTLNRSARILQHFLRVMQPIWKTLWVFSLVWIVIGTVWISKASSCMGTNPPIYFLALAQMVTQWVLVLLWLVLGYVDMVLARTQRHQTRRRRGAGWGSEGGNSWRSEDTDDILNALRVVGIDSEFWAPVDPDSLRPPGEGIAEEDWGKLRVFEYKKGLRKNSLQTPPNAAAPIHCDSQMTIGHVGDIEAPTVQKNMNQMEKAESDDDEYDEEDNVPLSDLRRATIQTIETDITTVDSPSSDHPPATTITIPQRSSSPTKMDEPTPHTKCEEPSDSSDITTCSICLFDYEPPELIRELKCGHWFHDECASRWLKAAKEGGEGKKTCPLCVMVAG